MIDTGAADSGPAVRIIGRSSSHFTRVARVFAEELAVPCDLVAVHDMTSLDPENYAGSPALKLPILMSDGSAIFGVQNICRALAELAHPPRRIVWPEDLRDVQSRNAQELVWHGMQAQVQLVLGTMIAQLPAQNVYFAKAAASLENVLGWLDTRLPSIRAALPPRDVSVFEVALFCLVEHLAFRPTLPVEQYRRLREFAQEFATRPSRRSHTSKGQSISVRTIRNAGRSTRTGRLHISWPASSTTRSSGHKERPGCPIVIIGRSPIV